MPTVEDLGKLVKEKYPTDAYKAMSDADLGRAVKTKYPGTAYDKYEDAPDLMAPPTTPTGLSSIASPPTPPEKPLSEQSGTLKGVGQHIVGGAVSAVPEIALQAGKLALSVPALLGKISAGKTPDNIQTGIDWIEDKQKQIGQYFESTYTAPDVNFSLGPLGKVGIGGTIGGIIPFAAAGSISAMSKAAKAVDVAVPVYEAVVKAMAHGAAFSAVYEVPNVIAAKTWKEAEQRAKDAGVSITLSAIMAGTFTGTAKGFGWAKEKMGRTPAEQMAKAQVIAEEGGVPNTEQLGANQPVVTPVDEVHKEIHDQKVTEKAARLEENIPKVETIEDKVEAHKKALLDDVKDTSLEKLQEEYEAALKTKDYETIRRAEARLETKGDASEGPPAPKQLDKAARVEQNLENMAQDPKSPGMRSLGDTLKRAEGWVRRAKEPKEKARLQAQVDDIKASIDRMNRKIAESLAKDQVENAKAAVDPPRQKPQDKSGKGAPTPGPEGPPDQRGPIEKAQQAIIEAGRGFDQMKDLAHQETEAAMLNPTLNKLTKERVVRLKQAGEELLAKGQRWLEDIQRAVNPISMIGREGAQAFVNFSGFKTEGGMLLDMMTKKLHEALPEKLDREFVTLLRDTAGHPEVAKLPRTEKINAALSVVDKFYDQFFKIGVEADIFEPKQAIKNFVNRVYSASDAKKILQVMEAQPLDAKNKHSFRRVFETMEQAAREKNIVPATLDIGALMSDYGSSLMKTMADGQLVRDMIKVMGHDLMWTAEKPGDARWKLIDDKLEAGYRETKLPDGKIQVERLYADEKLHKLLQAALDPNPLKGTRFGQLADLNTRYKSAMLALDIYHLANLTYQRTALNLVARTEKIFGRESAIVSFKEGLALFDPENPKFESLRMVVRNGLGLERGDWQKLMSLSVEDVKKGKADFVGKLWQSHFGLKQFNEFMWEKYHKGLKAATAVAEFERLLKDPEHSGKFTPDELARKAATFANNVYGGQSWSAHGRTAKFNAISRMILLAPDWFETRMNLAAGLGKIREGGQFKATAEFQMASRYWAGYVAEMSMAALMGNAAIEAAFPHDEALKKHPMKEGWKGLTNVVLPMKDRSGHNLVLGLGGSYRYVFDALHNLGQTMTNRESGMMRAGLEFYTQRDWTGKLTGPSMFSKGNLVHFGHNLIPIPLTAQILDIEFNAAGVMLSKNSIDMTRSLLRSLGTHPTTGYPMELRKRSEALKDRRDVVQHLRFVMTEKGRTGMAVEEVRKYNEEVKELMRDCQKTYRGAEVAKLLERLLITK